MSKLKKACSVLLKFLSEIVTSWASRSMSQPIISSWRPDLSFSAAIDSGPNKVRTSSSTLLISSTYVRLLEHAFRSSTYQTPAPLMVCAVMTSSVRETTLKAYGVPTQPKLPQGQIAC